MCGPYVHVNLILANYLKVVLYLLFWYNGTCTGGGSSAKIGVWDFRLYFEMYAVFPRGELLFWCYDFDKPLFSWSTLFCQFLVTYLHFSTLNPMHKGIHWRAIDAITL